MNRPARRLGSDLFLAFASLAIAFAIWMISKRGDLTVETFSVPIRLKNVPANVQARLEPDRNRAKITLPTPTRERSRIQADIFVVEYDFLKAFPEPRTWCGIDDFRPPPPIEPESASIQVVSGDEKFARRIARQLESATIDSSQVAVRGKLNTRPARLVFRTRGELPPGYRLAEAIKPTDLGTILLTASPEVFRNLAGDDSDPVSVETEEIDLNDQRKNFESTVALRLPPDVELVYPNDHRRVKAQVLIEEITAMIENVPVKIPPPPEGLIAEFAPKAVAVSVRGPEETLKKLKPADFIVRPAREIPQEAGPETTVPLEAVFSPEAQGDITGQVAIRSTEPAHLTGRYFAPRAEEPTPRSLPSPLEQAPEQTSESDSEGD